MRESAKSLDKLSPQEQQKVKDAVAKSLALKLVEIRKARLRQ